MRRHLQRAWAAALEAGTEAWTALHEQDAAGCAAGAAGACRQRPAVCRQATGVAERLQALSAGRRGRTLNFSAGRFMARRSPPAGAAGGPWAASAACAWHTRSPRGARGCSCRTQDCTPGSHLQRGHQVAPGLEAQPALGALAALEVHHRARLEVPGRQAQVEIGRHLRATPQRLCLSAQGQRARPGPPGACCSAARMLGLKLLRKAV